MKIRPTDPTSRAPGASASAEATVIPHITARLATLLIALCAILATRAGFGQTTYIWTNGAYGDIAVSTNWNPNGQPNGNDNGVGDIAQFNGQTAGPLTVISSGTSLPNTGFGTFGIKLWITGSQTSSVTLTSTVTAFSGSAPYGVNDIEIDSGAGAVTIGAVGGADRNSLYNFFGRPAGALHNLINNSANTATINGTVRWQAGGGAAYDLDFQGTGNWVCNNYLVNDNNAGMIIQVDGPGTMTWNPTGYLGNSGINSPITINAGELVLAGNHPRLNTQGIVNTGTFDFNAPSAAQTLSGAISGSGVVQVDAGTLTLQGASSYTGNTVLNGGELIVNSGDNGTNGPVGEGGEIVFSGGTLGFTVNNIIDYSGRFTNAAGQAYSIDTGGQVVTFTNAAGLTSSGGTLTKVGSGTLVLAGPSTYTGLTTVSVGELIFQGAKTGAGNITVADSAALGIYATGSQIAPGTLTLGSASGATLEFNDVSSTTVAPLAPATVVSAGTVTVNVNSGTFTPGQSYPLMTWTSGTAPTVNLGILNGYIGNLTISGNTLTLNVTATAFLWTGTGSGSWDLTTANNWVQNGAPALFTNGAPALLDDTATGATALTVGAAIQPTSVTVNNSTKAYSIASSGANNIGGAANLIKNGAGTLTLSGGANTYTGVTTLSGGTLSVSSLANGGSASDIGAAANSAANVVFNGGTLQYTGGSASVDRLFSISTAGGRIDASGSGPLTFNNTGALGYSGAGPRGLTLTGSDTNGDTLAAIIANNGGPTTVTKSGAGKWILTGTNTYSGVTTIASGLLQVGAGGTGGSLGSGSVVDDAALDFNRTGTLTVSGAVSGVGSVTNDGTGTVILAGNNTYTGGTAINAGLLEIGNGGGTGSLDSGSPIYDNGTIEFNSTSPVTLAGFNAVISGTGNVIAHGSGLVKAIGNNTYTGWTEIDPGATFQPCEGNQGQLLSSVVTNNGTLKFVRQDNNVFGYTNNIVGSGNLVKDVNNFNAGDATLMGTNTYTGGTIIAGGGIILGDGATVGAGSIIGNVTFTSSSVSDDAKFLTFDRPDDLTFPGLISGSGSTVPGNQGQVIQSGSDVLTLTANNTYTGGTTINAGTVQAGNGGTTGAIGSGPVVDNGTLVFNRSDSGLVVSAISGSGSVVQFGPGETTLSASNTYTGTTTVSNGTLVVSAVASDIDVNSGATLVPVGIGVVGTLYIGGNLNMTSGTIIATVNRSAAQTSSLIVFTNTTTLTEGTNTITTSTLKLLNYGPTVQVGDKFTIFAQPAGGITTIVSPGFTVNNNLAVDGSVTVASVVGTAPKITPSVSGGELTLTWPAGYTGLHLQMQSGAITNGLTRNWVTIPGSDAGNSYQTPATKTPGVTFYRLVP